MNKTAKYLSANFDVIKPYSVEEYVKQGGYNSLKKAISMTPEAVISEVKKAKLLGRGGAGYPAGSKWEHLLEVEEEPKYIVCNGDEGEPGTFKDKILLEKNPLGVIEGMTIAGYVFKAKAGYIYIRGEYRAIQKEIFEKALEDARAKGYLGKNICGTGFDYDIHIMTGAGAYVCGENSALLNSIEGKSGRPRIKPPHLAEVGLFLMPTLVNNVESFANIPLILELGGEQYLSIGTNESGGTKLVCLSGHIKNKGVYEVPFGVTLREIIYDEEMGGGLANNKKLNFFHIGGQSGPIGTETQLDTPYCYRELRNNGLGVGSGAIVVADDSISMIDYLIQVTEFFIHESCGKCTPCREGNTQILAILKRFANKKASTEDIDTLNDLISLLTEASFCGLGRAATIALKSGLKLFKNEFEAGIKK